jgi:Smg protein
MKQENIVDVIVYLLESVVSQQVELASEPAIVMQSLEEAGFARETIGHTFDWLKELLEHQTWYATFPNVNTNKTLRIFSLEEACRINLEIRGFILSLEYGGVLDTNMREIVISRLMQLDRLPIDLNDAKWVVLLVLMSKASENIREMRNYFLTTMAQKV